MNSESFKKSLTVLFALLMISVSAVDIHAQNGRDKKPAGNGGRFNATPGQRPSGGRFGGANSGRNQGASQGASGLRNRMSMLPIMVALDADKDGTISEQEIKNASKALLTLDKNKNRKIDPDELRPQFSSMAQGGQQSDMVGDRSFNSAQMVERMFSQNDKDGDGKLSPDEIPERMSQALDRIDGNGDGLLEKSEVEAFLKNRGNGQRPDRGASSEKRDSQGTVPKRPSDK